ncbi:hypothetical protein GT037_008194 [Alternaria burnsii]|uniref:Uncharacterized protein n=1 Tax=Alternaria burnsii TaxID=1187904 RepID=A0A8H7B6A6_9PLEO|nr:uncharacterized protein GT037_008194 [Alternaria burnsii]KAF7673579.1 hypothetical protein GT037_008194 [Alternaria burnsii]
MTRSAATDACASHFRLIIAPPRLALGIRRSSVQRVFTSLPFDARTGVKKGSVSNG